jgi:hypothetical protein
MQVNTTLLLSLCLILGSSLSAASSKSTALSVTIHPAVAVTLHGVAAIEIKIRLNREARVRIWKDEACADVPSDSYTIGQSGIYKLDLSQIDGSGSRLCLTSSDGTLSKAIPLPVTTTPAGL